MKNPDAKIIVLVPTIPLVQQQRARFDEAGFPANGYMTKSFSGYHVLSFQLLKP